MARVRWPSTKMEHLFLIMRTSTSRAFHWAPHHPILMPGNESPAFHRQHTPTQDRTCLWQGLGGHPRKRSIFFFIMRTSTSRAFHWAPHHPNLMPGIMSAAFHRQHTPAQGRTCLWEGSGGHPRRWSIFFLINEVEHIKGFPLGPPSPQSNPRN